MRCYILAIKAVLKINNIKIEEDKYLLTSLTRACHIKNDQIQLRLPIQRDMLEVLLTEIRKRFAKLNQPFLATLYLALLSSTYFGLLRVSEVTAEGHPILARDVHIAKNKKKMLFFLRSSKTHGKNVMPQMVKITVVRSSAKDTKLNFSCPYVLLNEYCATGGICVRH